MRLKHACANTLAAALLGGAVALFAAGCQTPQERSASSNQELLHLAVRYLWSQQSDDGGWHSATHGILIGGEAWTPFVAFYLLQVPDSVYAVSDDRVDAAVSFIRNHVNADGALGLSNPLIMEYPNYSTSYGLRVLSRWGASADSSLVRRMTRYLENQQFVQSRGIETDHRAYGGWGFGETGLPNGEAGHVDLSHTRRVLEALSGSGRSEHGVKAQRYLTMLQKHRSDRRLQPGADLGDPPTRYDGGFYSSTTALGMNKAGLFTDTPSDAPAYFRSYATATCDGVLALLAAGVSASDERVMSAAGWLARHNSLTTVDGIEPGQPGDWDRVLFYYHLLVRSEAYVALGKQEGWREEMRSLLAERQRSDGSFSNPLGAPNKEDDPILATAMAVGVLLNSSE